jgi:hypothetical protein
MRRLSLCFRSLAAQSASPRWFAVALGTVALLACTANTVIHADLRGRGAVPANEEEVKACAAGCAAQADAKCANADALACKEKCVQITSDQAVAFQACAKDSPCDSACASTIGVSGDTTLPADASAPVDAAKPPVPDASVPPTPPTPPTSEEGYSECLGTCYGAAKVKECVTTLPSGECEKLCKAASPSARMNFGSCASYATSGPCSTFLSTCWAPFSKGS